MEKVGRESAGGIPGATHRSSNLHKSKRNFTQILAQRLQGGEAGKKQRGKQIQNFITLFILLTGPLKLKYGSKNPRIGDYVQRKGLD